MNDQSVPSPPQDAATSVIATPAPSGRREFGAALLSILLWALLIDAAVETFLSGAPVRWWVTGIAATYLSLTAVVLWRGPRDRFGWSRRATASFFVLLALLAATVWLPEGLTNGVAMLRQSTSVVLSAVSALAVAVAWLVLVRVRFLPWWGRAAVGLLALYGVAAFVVGMIEGTAYPDLFRGESFWRRLPYWLQGAFIGTLVAVPLAMVAAIVDAFRHMRAVEGRGWGLQQSLALGLATLMAVSGFTMNGGPVSRVAAPGRGGPQLSAGEITKPLDDTYRELSRVLSGQKEGQPRSAQEVAQQLDRLFPALEAAAKEIPRDTFDMAAVVQNVGHDPVKLFEWVRDETYLVPYRGLLRGPTGVLMDRLSNSLDRAVLLHAMLGSIGQTVRLARGALTDEQASTLLEKARPVPPDGIPALAGPSSDPTEAVLRAYAQEQHLDQATLRQAVDKVAVEQSRVKEAVQNRVTQQTAAIAAAIGTPRRNQAEEDAQRVQAVRDHWWVEWQNGSAWTALDPSLPKSAPGATFTAANTTLAPEHFRDLGADQIHWIQLRVMVETWNRGQVSEAAVLTSDLFPAELIGKSIVLRFVPVAWPGDLNLFQEKDPLAKLKETVLAQTEWLPLLEIDGQQIFKNTFNEHGEVKAAGTEGAIQGLGSRIGGMLGGLKETEEQKSGQVTAAWIDYELHIPGQTSRTVRRDVFDTVGPAARANKANPTSIMTEFERLERGLALMGETEILPQVGDLSREFVEHLAATTLLANRDVLLGLVRRVDSEDPRLLPNHASTLSRMRFDLHTLALGRREWSRFPGAVYLDRPNILSYHRRLRANAKGDVLLRQGFDIVANDVSVRQQSGSDPFLLRVEQGVLDTNAEAFLAASNCQRSADSARCGGIHNTAEIFARSSGVGNEWVAIRDTRDAAWQRVRVPEDARARITQDLAGGKAVVVPTKAVAFDGLPNVGWWRLDAQTGQTLGIGEQGWGQSVEYTMLLNNARRVVIVAAGLLCMNAVLESDIQEGFHYAGVIVCLVGGGVAGAGVLVGGFAGGVLSLLSFA